MSNTKEESMETNEKLVGSDEGVTVEAKQPTVVEQIEALGVEIEQAEQVVAAARDEVAKANEVVNSAIKARDALIVRRDALKTSTHNRGNHGIVAYLKRQKEEREKRAKQMQELRERGFDLGPAKSRLDQSMARRNTRGFGRPSYPSTGGEKKD